MVDIDSLLISVTADSAKAQSALDGLASGLERMSQAINGVNASGLTQIANGITQIAQAMQGISGIDKRSFTSLAGKFNELNKIDGAKLTQTASTLEQIAQSFNGLSNVAIGSTSNIADLVKSIGSFGSTKVGNAITQIPRLGVALKELFVTLSTAPTVSANVIQMTNALANLANQGQKIGTATRSINSNLASTKKATKTASSGFKGLASAIGKFYAKYFIVMRAVKGIGRAIEKSMDYTETYNYWNVALDKVQKQYGADYKRWTTFYSDMGMNSAESYAKSFETRLKELVKKMSGNVIGDNGELMLGDKIGLGLDAEQLLNFQAKILGVTNSVGLLGETSVNTAKAMSMLAGDLSSLTNQSIETVMQNLQSGLIGMSRSLYKYGIDITNATLQEIAHTHAITKKVSAMSQSEKMQLRILAILDQSKIAWGDQSATINSVANQYRIFKQQVSNLARTLGNLLLPIVKTVLPYINAVIIVLQKLFTVLGFKLWGGSWLKDLQDGISGGAGAMDDEFGDVADDIEDISEKAKKLKKQLQGFDELNVITTNDDDNGGGGGGKSPFDLSFDIADALAEYEKVWEEALNKAKNKADEIAKAILDAFNKFKQSDFYKSMEKLFGTLSKLSKIAFKGLVDFYDKFLKPVAKWTGNVVFKRLVDLFVDFTKKVKWQYLLDALSKMWQVLAKFTINIGQGLLDFLSVVGKLALTALAITINVIAKALEFFFDCLLAVPEEVLYGIGVALGVVFTAFALSKLPSLIETVAIKFMLFSDKIAKAGQELIKFVATNPQLLWATVFIAVLGAIVYAVDELQNQIDKFTLENITNAMSGEVGVKEYADALVNDFNNIAQGFQDLNDKVTEVDQNTEKIDEVTGKIRELFTAFDNGADIKGKLDELVGYFDDFFKQSKEKFESIYLLIVGSLSGAIDDATTEETKKKYQSYIDTITGAFNTGEESFEDASKKMQELADKFNSGEIDFGDYMQGLADLGEKFGIFNTIDTSNAVNEIENLKKAIDFNDILDDEGKFDPDKWQEVSNQIADAYSSGTKSIEESTDSAKQKINEWVDTWVEVGQRDDIKNALSGIFDEKQQKAIDEYSQKLTNFTDNLSLQFLERIPEIVNTAQSDYSKFNFLEKLLYSTEDYYVSDVLEKHEKNTIKPFVKGMNELLEKTVGTETQNADWVESTYVDMFNNGFESASEKLSPYIAQSCKVISLKLGDDWEEKMQEVLDNQISPAMQTVGESAVDAFGNGVADADTSSAISDLASNVETSVQQHESWFEKIGKMIAVSVAGGFGVAMAGFEWGVDGDGSFSATIPAYATGGFPEDGLFMANHGEMVGRFANGKTAVANNGQIERGIANAVFDAITSAGGLGGGNSNVTIRLEGDAKGLFNAIQDQANDYSSRTGRPAFGY